MIFFASALRRASGCALRALILNFTALFESLFLGSGYARIGFSLMFGNWIVIAVEAAAVHWEGHCRRITRKMGLYL